MAKEVFFDNGTVSLGITRHNGTIMLYPDVRVGGHPVNHVGLVSFTRWTDRAVHLHAAYGTFSHEHQALIASALHEAGFVWMFVERVRGGIAYGKPCSYPPLDEMDVIVLPDAAQRAHKRYPGLRKRA